MGVVEDGRGRELSVVEQWAGLHRAGAACGRGLGVGGAASGGSCLLWAWLVSGRGRVLG